MKRILRLSLLMAAMFSMGALKAQKEKTPYFDDGPNNTDNGTTQTTCAKIKNLGNQKGVTITVKVTRTVTTMCTNPGGHVAPGQTRTETSTISKSFVTDKKGHVSFCITTDEPIPGPCPNGKWTATVTDVSFTNTTVWVNGQQVH